MLKHVMVAAAGCLAVAALGASTAAASVASQGINVCSGTGEWQLTFNQTGTSTATVSILSSNCKAVTASVEDDGNFSVGSFDSTFTATNTVNLTGVTVSGSPSFVGVGTRSWLAGPVEAVNGSVLNATLTGVNPATGDEGTVEYVGTGSCGTNCYRVNIVWSSGWRP